MTKGGSWPPSFMNHDRKPATETKKATFAGELDWLRSIAGEGFEPPTFGL
jgi:hypothetical protein